MKKLTLLLSILSFLLIPIKSFSYGLNNNEEYNYNITEENDMFSEYIKENSSLDDNKSTEINQSEYTFEWYPYINIKYISKTIKDEDKEINNAIEKR